MPHRQSGQSDRKLQKYVYAIRPAKDKGSLEKFCSPYLDSTSDHAATRKSATKAKLTNQTISSLSSASSASGLDISATVGISAQKPETPNVCLKHAHQSKPQQYLESEIETMYTISAPTLPISPQCKQLMRQILLQEIEHLIFNSIRTALFFSPNSHTVQLLHLLPNIASYGEIYSNKSAQSLLYRKMQGNDQWGNSANTKFE